MMATCSLTKCRRFGCSVVQPGRKGSVLHFLLPGDLRGSYCCAGIIFVAGLTFELCILFQVHRSPGFISSCLIGRCADFLMYSF